MNLSAYRNQLDQIDDQILALLHQRAEIVKKIGKLKSSTGAENIYVPHREKQIIDRLKAQNDNRFPVAALETVYTEIISACRALEKPLSIAFLGPVGSFGHAASLRHFGSSAEFIAVMPQPDIFTEVESGRADYGVVAIENSTYGTVRDVLEMFQQTTLQICSECFLPIDQNLLSKSPIEQITKIYSHPQPFAQCREWLRQNLKGVQQIEVASTSEAAQLAASEPNAAAIASKLAGEIYGLSVVGESVMDDRNNMTRFLVLGPHSAGQSGNDRTSILFAIKDRVGALWEVLKVLRSYEINMSKIESLPSRTKAWEYVFFVDLDGHVEDENVRKALAEIEELCVFVKILGAYPRGT
ncbi:MAG: prephenate dehydratase [Candidatus Poribacteria bacterium]|nr:prephenate dehydratase [Candidatus Poribacteria bacterium]